MNAVGGCSICFPLLQPPTRPRMTTHQNSLLPSLMNPACSFPIDWRCWLRRLRGGVGVHLALAAGHDDVHEAAGVCETLLRAALGDLLLLLLLDLWGAHAALADGVPRWMDGRWCMCRVVARRWFRSGGESTFRCAGWEDVLSYLGSLRLDLTGTRERTVNLTHVGV